jgi:geranylgeranyl reductase family protein
VTVAPADQAGQPTLHDVLVIGGGPAGSSCAYWLAEAGWDVVVVEKKHFPREKTCGDGLTPRSVRQLDDMGLKGSLNIGHRFVGLRSCAFGKTLEMRWPEHPTFPSEGFVITRMDLDQLVAERAAKAGADLRQGCEAVEPILGGTPAREGLPTVAGAVVADKDSQTTSEIKARYVVVADGSNSRFGRALGTSRDRGFPLGMALRGYYRSPRSDDQFIESHLDLRDPSGAVVPGYGWIFPLGNGLVNVGVGLLSVNGRWKGVNTSHLMDAFVESAPASWGLSPDGCCGPPTGGKLPMGFAVSPLAGANTIVVGDAAGCINPFNGEGIAYGYETGRLAASCLSRALAGEGDAAIAQYPSRLQDAYGDYYRVGRAFVKLISNPHALRACVRFGMEVPPVMVALMRIMANLMRPDTHAPPEMAYRAMEAVGRLVP